MPKPDIYAQHDAAFSRVSAYVVMRGGDRVATVAFRFPADGAGRLYAYVHWLGTRMVRGFAGGYGYDKRTAAVAAAVKAFRAHKIPADDAYLTRHAAEAESSGFLGALERDGGEHWDRALTNAGFTVLQAV